MLSKKKLVNFILVVVGTLSVVLGMIGIIVPLLPTTPFLLLAAACYMKSSKKLYSRLINNPFFGKYIQHYQDGKGIPLKTKITALSMLWLSIGYSILFVAPHTLMKGSLLIIAIAVSIHILHIKTLDKKIVDNEYSSRNPLTDAETDLKKGKTNIPTSDL